MIVICGMTCSGKTSIQKRLQELGYDKIVTYTTRPKRPSEVEGEDYHYITLEDFESKVANGFFAEYKVYHTVEGDWYYGTANEDLENSSGHSVIILTPRGLFDILTRYMNLIYSVYIDADLEDIRLRLIKRGDDAKEAERRLAHDIEDFRMVGKLVDDFIDNTGDRTIEDVAQEIIKNYWQGIRVKETGERDYE